MITPKSWRFKGWVAQASWRDLVAAGLPALLLLAFAGWVVVKALRFAPPTTIRLASGPDGSSYRNQAEKYKAILARDGVRVEVLATVILGSMSPSIRTLIAI